MNEAALQHLEAFLIDEASHKMAGLEYQQSSAFNWYWRSDRFSLCRLTVLPTLEDEEAVAHWKVNCDKAGVVPHVILRRGSDLSTMPHLWLLTASYLDRLPNGQWMDGGALVAKILTPDAFVLDDWHRLRHGMRRHWVDRAPSMPDDFWGAYALAFSAWYSSGCRANVDGPGWDRTWMLPQESCGPEIMVAGGVISHVVSGARYAPYLALPHWAMRALRALLDSSRPSKRFQPVRGSLGEARRRGAARTIGFANIANSQSYPQRTRQRNWGVTVKRAKTVAPFVPATGKHEDMSTGQPKSGKGRGSRH